MRERLENERCNHANNLSAPLEVEIHPIQAKLSLDTTSASLLRTVFNHRSH